MKKLLFFASVFMVTLVSAQTSKSKFTIEKGTWRLGGDVSFGILDITRNNANNPTNIDDKTRRFNFSPMLGYSLKDNLIVGVGLVTNYSISESSSREVGFESIENTSASLGFRPFIRGYRALGNRLAFYWQAEASYSRVWYEYQSENSSKTKNNGKSVFVGARPGVSFFASKKIAFEASFGAIGYSYYEAKGENNWDIKNNRFEFSLDASELLFGLAYYF